MTAFWHRLPVAVRAVITAFLVLLAGNLPWGVLATAVFAPTLRGAASGVGRCWPVLRASSPWWNCCPFLGGW